ncbi:MAG: hypothetical protein KGI78_02160 [Patescibacteria group bacterium]|nr:hypothetical protein [Patescibacteria group bacterium]MDE1944282.1 hypothetical protein [Patescibacteria group bacterium]MDE1945119.1 hypothetical protein [Patescibacteria group bacterium]MDE2057637.1 hypothetical protein [Patescibacteria group bacterium]
MKKPSLSRALALWVPFVVAFSGVFLFAAWAVQQNYRLGLDDPQIGMAEDAARALAGGVAPEDAVADGRSPVDMAASLDPWLAVYDASGAPVAANGLLDGALPQLPPGVFDTSEWQRIVIGHHFNQSPPDEFRFSWEPRYPGAPGGEVRQAVVLVHYETPTGGAGFVAAGRNMRVVESREATLREGAAILWGGTSLATLAAIILLLALGWL